MDSFNGKLNSKVGLLTSSHSYKPFRYPWAYDFWKRQQQVHFEKHPLSSSGNTHFATFVIFICAITFTIISILLKHTTKYSHSEVPQLSGSDMGSEDFHQSWKHHFSSWAPICIFIQNHQ